MADDEQQGGGAAPAPQYATLDRFVEDFLAVVYDRPTEQSPVSTWCPQWWRHDGAVARFTALHLAWEHMRVADGPTAMAAWLVNYADPIMAVVFDTANGPFKGCSCEGGHNERRPHDDGRLPCEPPPAGLFDERP